MVSRWLSPALRRRENDVGTHGEQILDQFTKQASLFQATHRAAEDAIRHAITVSGVDANDTVLDVACGPGVLTCAFAKVARHVTGIDITPKMLEQARALQETSRVRNVGWLFGDVYQMPFDAGRFSMIITRYALHHLERPDAVVAEMARVCQPEGQVVIIDSAPPLEKAAAFNDIERLRDPSHTRALTAEEVAEIMATERLHIVRRLLYAWEVTAESLLARSFPADGDREKIFRTYEADVGVDKLAMNARRLEGTLYVTLPTMITVGRKS
jgi:ubiquinone/menaquinone biosynthesis C-methylase UbiE